MLGECSFPSTLLRPHVPVHLPLPTFASTLGQESLPLRPPTAGQWTFPTLHLRIFHWMPRPLPRRLQRCSFPFLPFGLRPSLSLQQVGALLHSARRLQRGEEFRGCRHFFMLRPPVLLATQVAPTAAVLSCAVPCFCLRRRVTISALSIAKWGHSSSIASSRCSLSPQGSRGVYVRAEYGSLPSRTSDMLAV